MSLRDDYLNKAEGDILVAALLFARDLMRDDPATFKVGYSAENAALAALDIFPEVGQEDVKGSPQPPPTS